MSISNFLHIKKSNHVTKAVLYIIPKCLSKYKYKLRKIPQYFNVVPMDFAYHKGHTCVAFTICVTPRCLRVWMACELSAFPRKSLSMICTGLAVEAASCSILKRRNMCSKRIFNSYASTIGCVPSKNPVVKNLVECSP